MFANILLFVEFDVFYNIYHCKVLHFCSLKHLKDMANNNTLWLIINLTQPGWLNIASITFIMSLLDLSHTHMWIWLVIRCCLRWLSTQNLPRWDFTNHLFQKQFNCHFIFRLCDVSCYSNDTQFQKEQIGFWCTQGLDEHNFSH